MVLSLPRSGDYLKPSRPGKYSGLLQQRIDRVLGRSTTKAKDEALLRDRFAREGQAKPGKIESVELSPGVRRLVTNYKPVAR